jgi:putative ABC transport system ATP-binding protein
MSDALLHAGGLGRHVGDNWIWRGVGIELRAGEQLALVGPTGSGKSLLLRCLASLDAADVGDLAFEARPPTEWTFPEYRARVVYLHQRPALWEGTVEDNLRAVFKLTAHHAQEYDRPAAVDWLAAFDRGETFLEKSTTELSGGEQQITALVRALGIDPAVLLLDEPSASMDADATRHLEALIAQWVVQVPGRAVVWASHDAEQVARVANRTLTLNGGAGTLS